MVATTINRGIMRGISKSAIEQVEALAKCLIKDAVQKHGKFIPTNDPDFCEAFGVLRGAMLANGQKPGLGIRVAPGSGDPTHGSVHAWYREILDRVLASIDGTDASRPQAD